jgi:hypothetical protein
MDRARGFSISALAQAVSTNQSLAPTYMGIPDEFLRPGLDRAYPEIGVGDLSQSMREGGPASA